MIILFKMALRNILRHKKRSLITLLSVCFSLGSLIFLKSFVFGAQQQMKENVTRTLTGDLQILPKSLENIYNTNGAIEDPEKIRSLLKQDAQIESFAENVLGTGLVSSDSRSLPTFIIGLDPGKEAAIGNDLKMIQGHHLTEGDTQGIILGEKMREILGLQIGDRVIVTAQDYYGSLSGSIFYLVGTFEVGNDQLDSSNSLFLKSAVQKLLSFEHRISKFILKIDAHQTPDKMAKILKEKMNNNDLKVMTWEELIPMVSQLIQFQNGMVSVVMAIVLIVVSAGILNTLLMSTIERTREFGLMMALGTHSLRILMLIVFESLLLTGVGALIGSSLGILITFYFGHHGIDLSRFLSTFSNLLIGSKVFPQIHWSSLILFSGVILVASLFVSLYPAWKASKLEPIEAMRQTF